jgi:hypothetical protein
MIVGCRTGSRGDCHAEVRQPGQAVSDLPASALEIPSQLLSARADMLTRLAYQIVSLLRVAETCVLCCRYDDNDPKY